MRLAICLAACLALVAPGMTAAAGKGSDPTVVATADGRLRGVEAKGVYAFKGVHYGADTGGANRFMPPAPVVKWQGVKAATADGNRCPQPPLNGLRTTPQVILFSDLPVSEDCLVLNVWTPKPDRGRRPVMVFLHGGAFSFGSGSDKYYEGSNLARTQDVVVVTLNHRVNAFGYMPMGPDAGAAYAASGNNGMLDIVAALKWVKANIAAFGGDPSNVTLFGQSGGGGKVSTLLAMPGARGLFGKAIIESGADLVVSTQQDGLAQRDKVLAALGLKPGDWAKLRDVPMKDLIAAATKAGLLSFRPQVDGIVLMRQPFEPDAPPSAKGIPLMIGFAHDEATDLLIVDPAWPSTTDEVLAMKAKILAGPQRGPAAIAFYRARSPGDEPKHILASIVTDMSFGHKTLALAERKAAQPGAAVFVYRIDWKSPVLDGVLRAPHGVELAFVFDNVADSAEIVGAGGSQDRMAAMMSAMWAGFARTGNPSVSGYPAWPAYDVEHRQTYLFDDPPRVAADPDAEVRLFWNAP
ncbi:MAG: hypothetical protein JWP35_2800 [Caulobacter sp.]|nr:hypothetical protein [Caulobacter sp.]